MPDSDPYTTSIGPGIAFSAMVFLVAVVEQGRYSFASRLKTWPIWAKVAGLSAIYCIFVGLLTGNLFAVVVFAVFMAGLGD